MEYENKLINFRNRIRSGDRLYGTFVKSPTSENVEIVAALGFDFVIIDAEHAPLGRREVDQLCLAAKAAGIPALVRVNDASAATLLSPLDSGAAGVVVPHVVSGEMARQIAVSCKYRPGGRGFSAATRSAGYGSRAMTEAIDQSNLATSLIVQIEDEEALHDLQGILACDDVDGVLIGRADLAVSLGEASASSQRVMEVVKDICRVCANLNKSALIFAASAKDARALLDLGATVAVVGSDQAYLRDAARETIKNLKNPEFGSEKKSVAVSTEEGVRGER